MKKRLYKLCTVSALVWVMSACADSNNSHQSKFQQFNAQPAKWKVFEDNDKIKKMATALVDQYSQSIFDEGNPLGMAMVVIDNNQVVHRSFGETYPGSGVRPRRDSLIRIASITKLMTSEVMIKLAQNKRLKITDPLQKYSHYGVHVPDYGAGQPIRLYHLASHTTIAAAGSGGIYSTPADMQRWMQQFLSSHNQLRKQTASREQGIYFKRADLTSIKGMDVAGLADGIGLGWVYMEVKGDVPGIYQKTGGGGGFNSYMAMIPERNIGVFVVMTRKEQSKFSRVTSGVNELVAALARNHNQI
ncbi:serine hydrolase [Xenorhabdus japonica]|uniref:D-alanyl-D-alanine-carboxypeptidase / D-alanyl-D-alanine-endopeptidase n=1 Tax=Xenorhabdus japonica TaxID=53341 RepID=A0A1I4YDI3_9GAMM|nr:serine hydrolase [Xenorhabdus japonica]SFN36087.1 D-alanyl-D-alanine-carboxypeptidase / D-alanyl-D-alanine-endopeptidase [Xenorhabdus japonica]